jgi:hypothetical protein
MRRTEGFTMRCSKRCFVSASVALVSIVATTATAGAQIFGGTYAGHYSATEIDPVPGLPGAYGGLVFERGDAMTLLIGGNADTSIGAVYAVDVTRDAFGHVDGFASSAVKLADAPFIDGGLTYAPRGVLLYTAFPINVLGQILPGASGPSKTTLLSGLGVGGSVGGCAVVVDTPAGQRLKLTSPGLSRWYDAPLVNDGLGTFNVGLAVPHGPAVPQAGNMVFVAAGQPGFAVDTVLVSSCNGAVGAYSVDANGDIVANIGSYVIAIAGCADGMCIDPLTGDLLLCITNLKKLFVVRGFTATATFCEPLVVSTTSCTPSIAWSGTPTLTGADDFVVRCDQTPLGQNGIEIWSLETQQKPFASAFLCVAQPFHRIQIPAVGGPGGAINCTGVLSQAWTHSFFNAHALTAGLTVYTQFVVRDHSTNAVSSLLISDALRFTVTH